MRSALIFSFHLKWLVWVGSTTRRCFTHHRPNLLSACRFILLGEATSIVFKTTAGPFSFLRDTLAIWHDFLWNCIYQKQLFLFVRLVCVFSFHFCLAVVAEGDSGFSITKLPTFGQALLVLSHIFWSYGALPLCYCYGGTATVLMDGRRQKFTPSIMHAWPTS